MCTKSVFSSLGITGSVGLALTLALNLAALLLFHRPSAHFFVGKWWSDWFVNYIVWASMALIGIAGHCTSSRSA